MPLMIRRHCVFTAVLVLCLFPLRSQGTTGESLDRLVAKDWAARRNTDSTARRRSWRLL